ncbi:hypothetical protein AB5J62_35985 [Amycolatopsis sp. cg5]|uniref:hypothetical protein n=1 Tax=Amycolatopsis sp. cg5 TaxID=3238802 RepID=UPI003526407C
MTARGAWLLVLLGVDAALLAVLELFFLPLRLDGVILPRLGDIPFPVAAVVAAVTTPLLVIAAAKLVKPSLSFVPLLVWVVVTLFVGLSGPGGDFVLIQDWRALILVAAGALPGAFVLGGKLGGKRV